MAIVGVVWAIVCLLRAGATRDLLVRREEATTQLTRYARASLEHSSIDAVVTESSQTASLLFGIRDLVAILPGEDGWTARRNTGEALAPIPAEVTGLFSWFKHNPHIAERAELHRRTFGAMRHPISKLMQHCDVDVLMPLVDRDRLLAVLGFRFGRKLNMLERELFRVFRLEATYACANIKLHHQAASLLSMAKEVDLATSIELTMVPEVMAGEVGHISWAGHFEAGGTAGSDFWGIYPLEQGRIMVLIGDAVGRDLAGTMVSAVIKSSCDEIFERRPKELDPSQLLTLINGSLFRPTRPALASCFAALLDPTRSLIFYANAGHIPPYRLRKEGNEMAVSTLGGSGALLGDVQRPNYRVHKTPLTDSDCLVLLTDGLVEACNASGTPFGYGRMARLLKGLQMGPPDSLRRAILSALSGHRGAAPAEDDQALLVVRCS
jgi:serine phosphatase RsbU (regulator of sigma subunit)